MDMKKLTAILFVLLALLCGCAKESAYQPAGAENVTMTVSNVTPTGVTVVIQDDNRVCAPQDSGSSLRAGGKARLRIWCAGLLGEGRLGLLASQGSSLTSTPGRS